MDKEIERGTENSKFVQATSWKNQNFYLELEASPRVKTGFVVLNSWDFLVSRMCCCKNPASGSEGLCSASGISKAQTRTIEKNTFTEKLLLLGTFMQLESSGSILRSLI